MTSTGIRIAPSILSADFGRLGFEARRMERAGADWLHVDVMDGHFVPNLTIGPVVVKSLKKHTRLPLDVHLMIEKPERYIEAFAQAGAWNVTVHWEACPRPRELIKLIRRYKCSVGISIKPATPVHVLWPLLDDLDLVLVMTVEPGFGGQSFMPDMIPKIQALSQRTRDRSKPFILEVDGGIAPDTAPRVVAAGANALVAGHAIFSQPHPTRALKHLRRVAEIPVL